MERNPLDLSERQAAMLLFLDHRRDQPCGDPRTTDTLIRRGLVQQDPISDKCETTELGHRVAAQLDRLPTPRTTYTPWAAVKQRRDPR